MNAEPVEYQRVSLRPVECLKASKDLIGDQYWLFCGIAVVGILIASAVPLGILMGPMVCGIYYCFFRRMRGETVEFGMLFKGFDYFVESLVATLILVGVALVVMLPMYCLFFAGFMGSAAHADKGGGQPPNPTAMFGMMGLLYIVVLAACLVLMVFFCFAYPLIVDRGLKAVPALRTSLLAAWANFGSMLSMMCLLFLITIFASLCCYVPALLFMPFYMGTLAVAYRKVFPDGG